MSTAMATLPRVEKLVWFSTARRESSALGVKKVWRTKCGRYQVTTFEEGRGDFSAWVLTGRFFTLLGRRRKVDHAVSLCCTHAKGVSHESCGQG